MPNIPRGSPALQTLSTEHYADVVAFWCQRHLLPAQLKALKAACPGGIHYHTKPMRFDPKWIVRIAGRQPTQAFFDVLASIEATQPVMINYVEFARDECVPTRQALERLYEYRCNYEIRLWHSKKDAVVVHESGTTYDARRRRPRTLARYMDSHCRTTGELYCLHTELRMRGAQSLRRLGIHRAHDVVNFDHVKLWRTKTRVIRLEEETFGRYLRNRRDNTRSRQAVYANMNCRRINLDRRWGHVLCSAGGTMQGVVDLVGLNVVKYAASRGTGANFSV